SVMLREHIEKKADISVACIEVPVEEARDFGVLGIDQDENIITFVEKPENPPTIPGNPERSLASMGIYIFNASMLSEKLASDALNTHSSHDFGKDIIPSSIGLYKIVAHPFSRSSIQNVSYDEPYWRDVGTLSAYWQANIDLTKLLPRLDLYDDSWPIRTVHYQRAAAKFNYNYKERLGTAINSVVSAGCIVSGSTVEQSILFNNVRVNSFSVLKECVVLPGCDIGRNCRLTRVVLDSNCQVPEGTIIGEDAALDAQHFYRNEDGIVLVTSAMIAKLAAT
ncbi:MAG: glucose-1-phosphate adenylyltransferase, partial [Gammaproteobacteria bacterium]|nr:glucose-1-phosphate adenylyltransferase [Gammaproteobacteria bacterium]